jgi:glucose/arabinose dehydrogenase
VKSFISLLTCVAAFSLHAATLPGFRIEKLGSSNGDFISSIAIDSRGNIDYTTTAGDVIRFDNGANTVLAHVTTEANSNSGLLGMALLDDTHAVVHYTTFGQTYDVLSRIDLVTGEETVLHPFVCDIDVASRGSSPEHHGGNPSVGADGSIVVGIGDYGGGLIASLPEWNAGKIFRITPDGEVTQIARGLRNPFDLIWDAAKQRVIVADNGPGPGDDINIVTQGANLGWPFTFAGQPPADGILPPIYRFVNTIAPTGTIALNGANPQLRSGILLCAYVTKAIYYIPDIDARPLPDPIALIDHETGPVIDVAQSADGQIYFVTGGAIYRLIVPERGDCNGDGHLNSADLDAFERELAHAPEATFASHASWGCDANGDGTIDANDRADLVRLTAPRRRAVSLHR